MQRIRQQLAIAVASSEAANWIQYLLLLVGLAVLLFIFFPAKPFPFFDPISWKDKTACRISTEGAQSGQPTLRVRVLSGLEGLALCKALADKSALTELYADIDVHWEPAPIPVGRAIAERAVDLVLLRPDTQRVSEAFLGEFYSKLAYYRGYDAFLIAADEHPILEVDYFQSRRIGLLSKEESRSGYILPMRFFHKLGLNVAKLDIRYYPGHAELRQAMARGEVDIISSYWNERDQARFPNWRKTEIDHASEGLNWYLAKTRFNDRETRCAIISVLERLATGSDGDYFLDLRLSNDAHEPCQNNPAP